MVWIDLRAGKDMAVPLMRLLMTAMVHFVFFWIMIKRFEDWAHSRSGEEQEEEEQDDDSFLYE